MHGLEAQTVESISLLKKRRIPFVIALNKIDRINGWKSHPDQPFLDCLKSQAQETIENFQNKMSQIIAEIAMQGLNAVPYYKNTDFKKYISICPTSAMTGEGLQVINKSIKNIDFYIIFIIFIMFFFIFFLLIYSFSFINNLLIILFICSFIFFILFFFLKIN